MKPAMLALALSAAVTSTVLAGPPHIRAALRGHPTAGGFIVLTTFHHATQQAMPLTGSAEGLVGGRRTSSPLRFEPVAGEDGAFVVPRTWEGAGGVFVLNIATPREVHGGAGIVVGVDRTGRPEWQIEPRTLENFTRPASASEVEALLLALRDGRVPPQLSSADLLGFAARNRGPLSVMTLLAVTGAWLAARVTRSVMRRAGTRGAVAG